jgi:hypothetical protein
MPADHRIVPERNLMIVEAHGEITDDELVRVMHAGRADPAFSTGLDLLGDFRYADLSGVSTATVRALGEGSLLRGRRALVLPAGVGYGIGRMYSAYAARGADSIAVFTRLEEAEEWLGIAPG